MYPITVRLAPPIIVTGQPRFRSFNVLFYLIPPYSCPLRVTLSVFDLVQPIEQQQQFIFLNPGAGYTSRDAVLCDEFIYQPL